MYDAMKTIIMLEWCLDVTILFLSRHVFLTWMAERGLCLDANFFVTGGIAGCGYDNFQYYQWQQYCHLKDSVIRAFFNI